MSIDISIVRELTEEKKERHHMKHLFFYYGCNDHNLNNCTLRSHGPKCITRDQEISSLEDVIQY